MTSTADTKTLFLAKLIEQAALLERLISLIPEEALDWRPEITDAGDSTSNRAFSFAELLGHLLDCLSGFCATLYAAHPDQLAHFGKLRERPVNHRCEIEEAKERLREYVVHIEEGFSVLNEGDLPRLLPTVFAKEGEAVLTLLLGNLEHLINHKHQLFLYLKRFGIHVSTSDLYVFR